MSTRDDIMDVAEELIMIRGYNAFSYQDVARRLGIKTASIHYHFPKKSVLGLEVVRRYRGRVEQAQELLDADESTDEARKFEVYLEIFMNVASADNKICACGALGGEFSTLPPEIQSEVVDFFELHEVWLAKLFQAGRKSGALIFDGSPKKMAKLVFATLEGALIIARSRQDPKHFFEIAATLKRMLRGV